ncbi:MAG: response regulator transcription factor [Parashewanella sp.]
MTKVLIIEDDELVNQLVSDHLTRSNYQVTSIHDGLGGLYEAQKDHYDLILLDIMLPNESGWQILDKVRENSSTPVLILSALGGEQDRIQGFRTGADDYLCKPFNMSELELRIEAILRRTQQSRTQKVIECRRNSNHIVKILNREISFTLIESLILKSLMKQAGVTLSKPFLYQTILHKEYSRYDRTLDMHISKIRKKLQAQGVEMNVIQTVHGQGYRCNTELEGIS